jgi:hypothetical protein
MGMATVKLSGLRGAAIGLAGWRLGEANAEFAFGVQIEVYVYVYVYLGW